MRHICKNIALRSAMIFLFWGATWIFLSDNVLYLIAEKYGFSAALVESIQGVKGLFFVVTTAFILYAVVRSGETKLRETKRNYRDLFRMNPTAMFIFDINTGQMFSMNEAACSQYGYEYKEMKALKVNVIHPPSQRAELERRLRDAVTDLSDMGIWRHRRKDGQNFWVHLYARKIQFNGADARLVLAFDINEEIVTKEQLLHQNNQLADIAWHQSHGLRAPIATILGLLNLYNFDEPSSKDNIDVLMRLKQSGTSLDMVLKELSRKTTNPLNYPGMHEMGPSEMHGINCDTLNLQRASLPPRSIL